MLMIRIESKCSWLTFQSRYQNTPILTGLVQNSVIMVAPNHPSHLETRGDFGVSHHFWEPSDVYNPGLVPGGGVGPLSFPVGFWPL